MTTKNCLCRVALLASLVFTPALASTAPSLLAGVANGTVGAGAANATAAAGSGGQEKEKVGEPADAMAAAERAGGGGKTAFVAASSNPVKETTPVEAGNADEIQISDEE